MSHDSDSLLFMNCEISISGFGAILRRCSGPKLWLLISSFSFLAEVVRPREDKSADAAWCWALGHEGHVVVGSCDLLRR